MTTSRKPHPSRSAAAAAVMLVALAAGPVARAEWHVWTVADTVRVLRDAPAGQGTDVALAAARNEWESFQVLVRADEPVADVTVEPGDLRGPGGHVLAAREARLYRQHQLELTLPTYRNEAFRPGWYPDPLIPFRHPLTGQPLKGARLSAAPFDLPAGETHGFWVDLLVPPAAPPGTYRGTYRVAARARPSVPVPVTLTVWGFALPAVATMRTCLGSPAERMQTYYRARAKVGKEAEPADWAAVEAQAAGLLARHRVNATPPPVTLTPREQPDGSYRLLPDQVRGLAEFADRYAVNAVLVPHPKRIVQDPVAERARLHAWLRAWDQAALDLRPRDLTFYTYLIDEPNDADAYRHVQTWGRAIRAARSALKVMVTEQTWPQDPKWGDLYGAVDIWCPLFSLLKPESAAIRQGLGETVWAYTALCQGTPTPWWHIDWPLLNYRVPAWIAWRFRIRGLLYWGGMAYWNQVEDPWTDPKTYDRRREAQGLLWNGEGTLVYPGRAAGYDGIAPSLRLKALRDAIEDYEFLAILERGGLAAEAEKIVLPLAASWFQWEKDPAAYAKARAALAALIVAHRLGR